MTGVQEPLVGSERLQALAGVGCWAIDLVETTVELSAEASRILGLSTDGPVTVDELLDHVHPEDRSRVAESWSDALAGEPIQLDHRMKADGEPRWVQVTIEPDSSATGPPTRAIGVVQDITDHKSHEREIARLNDLHETVLSNIRDAVLITDDDGQFTYVCPNVNFLFGYDRDEVRDLGTVDSLLGDPLVASGELSRKGEISNIETTVTDSGGMDHHVLVTVTTVSIEEGTTLYNVRDITERKAKERDLRRSHDLLAHTEQLADVGGWELDLDTGELLWTDGTRDIHDVPRDYEPSVEAGVEFYHPDDRSRIVTAFEQCRDEGEPYDVEARLITATGRTRWVQTNGWRVEQEGSTVLRGAIWDITEHKRRETALERSRDLLARTEQLAAVGGWQLDIDTGRLTWTDGTKHIHGVPDDYDPNGVDEAIDFYHPDDRERIKHALARCRETGEPYDIEARLETAEGDIRWVETSGERTESDGATIIHGAIMDITGRKDRERALERANDQLRILNRITRHDIRNDMNVVLGWSGELSDHVDPEGEPILDRIESASQHVVDLTITVRDFIRTLGTDEDPTLEPTDLGSHLIQELEKRRAVHPGAKVELLGDLPASKVTANDLLSSVFRNLLNNAVQHNDKPDPVVEVRVEASAETVTVRIADNGPGIPDERKDAVFGLSEAGLDDPSAGIGLYLVQTLVEQYGGTIAIEDNEPAGSVFVLELPRAEPAAG